MLINHLIHITSSQFCYLSLILPKSISISMLADLVVSNLLLVGTMYEQYSLYHSIFDLTNNTLLFTSNIIYYNPLTIIHAPCLKSHWSKQTPTTVKGLRAPTHNLILLMHITMILNGFDDYLHDESIKINHVGKPKTTYARLSCWSHKVKRSKFYYA